MEISRKTDGQCSQLVRLKFGQLISNSRPIRPMSKNYTFYCIFMWQYFKKWPKKSKNVKISRPSHCPIRPHWPISATVGNTENTKQSTCRMKVNWTDHEIFSPEINHDRFDHQRIDLDTIWINVTVIGHFRTNMNNFCEEQSIMDYTFYFKLETWENRYCLSSRNLDDIENKNKRINLQSLNLKLISTGSSE